MNVSRSAFAMSEVFETANRLSSRMIVLLGLAGVFATMGLLLPDMATRLACAVGAGSMIALIVIVKLMALHRQKPAKQMDKAFFDLVGMDAAPCFATDDIGQIVYQNAIAIERFGPRDATTLVSVLKSHFTAPDAVLYRLQNRAGHQGHAREDVVTRRGHLRLSVHRVAERQFLWRLEEFQDRVTTARGGDTLSLPMLVVNKAGVVLFCNDAARRLVAGRPKRLEDVFSTDRLYSGEEVVINAAGGPVRAILAEVEGPGERREIYLLPVAARTDDRATLTDFEELPVALMKFTSEGALVAANRAARELVPLDSATGVMAHEIFEGLGRPIADWLADVIAERLPAGSEVLRAHGSDAEAFLQITLRRIVELGRPGVLAVLQDATKLKTLEAQFVQSQKMQAIGQLAGGVAHDFNNLLTAISGHCDLLLLRHGREDTDFGDLVQISQNANRAAALVGQLLAFSRKQTLKSERLLLQDVLSDLTHLLNRLVGEKVRLRLAHAPDLGSIRADKRQFEQVIMNLVVNARDAMPHGGTIRVETEAMTLTEDMHRNGARVPAGDYAVIRVQDAGVGIAEDKLEKIFEPFYTTKRPGEGTGLGLPTVYGIVKQSGGFIFVDSTLGEGTLFSLYFPINETVDTPRPEFVATPRYLPRNGHGTVLLVEDEAPVRAFASRALRLRGYTVIEADCAEEALRALEDPTVEVDVFVTDVVMPGMDGPSWVKEALVTRPNVRVVFVSGYAEDVLSEEQSRIPNSVFLPKPFSLNELTATVQTALH
jgi:two-component system, cell cycle sensor histidine kinase and response regulator CckA